MASCQNSENQEQAWEGVFQAHKARGEERKGDEGR